MRRIGVATGWRGLIITAAMVSGAALVMQAGPSPAGASTLPSGFRDSVVLSGLTNPTVLQFAPDGRIFVGQKNGVIKVFQSLTDTNPVTFADLSGEVDDYWDRGLLGLALPANFPASPYVYVLYTYDAPIGGTAPTWNDGCPTPPGPTTDGCVVSARVSRLQISGNVMTGTEQMLVNDWCQQFPSHSIGTLLFGRDGYLYAGGGDGASFNNVDYGQYGATYAGDQANPCGDPPGAAGTALSPPGAEGGALRSQSVRRTDGPATLDGAIIRINPDTGQGLPDNPFAASADPNARRIVAYGLRQPFRMTMRPGTSDLWLGDVGWNTSEEIDRLSNPTASPVKNFGWPCYEGRAKQPTFEALNLDICNTVYGSAAAVAPYFEYEQGTSVVRGDGCPTRSSAISGDAFYPATGGNYPAKYRGALFFADWAHGCIWAMLKGANGLPDPTDVEGFVTGAVGASTPVDLEIGPGGDLFYVDVGGGTIRRVSFNAGNHPPVAAVEATPTTGDLPLPDRNAFIKWVRDGHGFVAMHSGSDTYHGYWPYIQMLGGEFETHGAQESVECIVADPNHPATKNFGATYNIGGKKEEIYIIKSYDPATVHELLYLDKHPNTKAPGHYAVSWCKDFGQGRIFYTSLGHPKDFEDENFKRLLVNALYWTTKRSRN
jgi:glucose/arabinose dehydrogenase